MADGWTADLHVATGSAAAARRLFEVLGPESSREVPRARAAIAAPDGDRLTIHIEAKDTGALRASLQTFLGWVQLEAETSARGVPPS